MVSKNQRKVTIFLDIFVIIFLAKTTGKGWFNMKQPELTDEVMMDLKAIKMRNLIYRKRFYKGNDTNKLPTFFQVY